MIEAAESTIVCAQRELQEAGLAGNSYREIGTSPHAPRRDTAMQHIVMVSDVYVVERVGGDAEEQGMELVWVNENEVNQKIYSGEITQKNTLAAWAVFSATDKR